MIGDKLTYFEAYQPISDLVLDKLKERFKAGERLCIAVGGESGCGKSSLAYAIKLDIEQRLGLQGFLFQMDDYFKLPPADNHSRRLDDIRWVGMEEVRLDLLDENLHGFKQHDAKLMKPLVNYSENVILEEQLDCTSFDFCVVEGTYVTTLKSPDYKIFIKTTYLETRASRIARARDLINDFNEEVLLIEHQIIREHHRLADVVIDKELNISLQ